MSDGQSIILLFLGLLFVSFVVVCISEAIDEAKENKKQVKKLQKQVRELQEEAQKQRFLNSIIK